MYCDYARTGNRSCNRRKCDYSSISHRLLQDFYFRQRRDTAVDGVVVVDALCKVNKRTHIYMCTYCRLSLSQQVNLNEQWQRASSRWWHHVIIYFSFYWSNATQAWLPCLIVYVCVRLCRAKMPPPSTAQELGTSWPALKFIDTFCDASTNNHATREIRIQITTMMMMMSHD